MNNETERLMRLRTWLEFAFGLLFAILMFLLLAVIPFLDTYNQAEQIRLQIETVRGRIAASKPDKDCAK